MDNIDILLYVKEFSNEDYLWWATVSTSWNCAYGNRPKITRAITAETSMQQLFLSFELGLPKTKNICTNCAISGYLTCLQFCRELGCPWDSETCAMASSEGHLELLKWARTNGCEWRSDTCHMVASEGHLEVLKWARKNDCPWTSYTLELAAYNEKIEFLEWATNNGLGWSDMTVRYTAEWAAMWGHFEVIDWMRNRQLLSDEESIIIILEHRGD